MFSPLWISLKVSVLSTFFSFWISLLVVMLIQPRRKFHKFFDTAFALPTVISPTVMGFLLLLIFGRNSLLGGILQKLGIRVIFSLAGAVIASMSVSIPIIYQAIRSAFDSVEKNIIEDARMLGLSEMQIFTKISLPISFRFIRFALILAFARSMGEFGATIMVAGNIPEKTQTLTVAIYTAVQGGDMKMAFEWIFIMLTISFISIFALRSFKAEKND